MAYRQRKSLRLYPLKVHAHGPRCASYAPHETRCRRCAQNPSIVWALSRWEGNVAFVLRLVSGLASICQAASLRIYIMECRRSDTLIQREAPAWLITFYKDVRYHVQRVDIARFSFCTSTAACMPTSTSSPTSNSFRWSLWDSARC